MAKRTGDSRRFVDDTLDFLSVEDDAGNTIVPPGPEETEAEFDERLRDIRGDALSGPE